MTTESAPRTAPLEVCTLLFRELEAAGLRYCHWKSNEHLLDGLRGDTDLDVLVHPQDSARFAELLARCGFKALALDAGRDYEGRAHFLGFDRATGKLAHIDSQTQLILGAQHFKNYRLPIENSLLDEPLVCHGVRIARPALELLLLLIRAHLKLNPVHLATGMLGSTGPVFPENIRAEFVYLLGQCDVSDVIDAVKRTGLALDAPTVARALTAIQDESYALSPALRTRAVLRASLRAYQRLPVAQARQRYAEQALRRSRLVGRLKPVRKRTLRGQGAVFALVGADGSGKSTLAADLVRWLSWKLDVRQVYLGRPKSLSLRAVETGVGALGRLRTWHGLPFGGIAQELGAAADARAWIAVAKARARVARQAAALAQQGSLVIADRFPLQDFWHMQEPMDGPRIRRRYGERFPALADEEEGIYRSLRPPDRVFVLKTSLETLLSRKPGLALDLHRAKAQAVNAIGARDGVEVVDGERPYEAVLLDLKRRIWDAL